jgi:acyl-CoA synthetase (AMP-forming)/AMP-acid ligase II
MNSLKSNLQNIPGQRIALATNGIKLLYKDIENLIFKNSDTIEKIKTSNVVINGRGRLEFAKLLFLLDGEVNSILFLPQDIDEKLFDKYYNESQINFEVYLDGNNLKFNTITNHIPIELDKTSWIIPTSGTTNIPKLVSHTFESLTRTTKRNISIGQKYRWGLVFDIYRFSGIQVFLQAMLSGSTLIVSEAGASMSEISNNLIINYCNALSATPSFWRKVMMTKEFYTLELKVITLGGEIADENILQGLKSKFNDAKVLHIYASTEAGVGFSVTDAHSGFPKKYLDNGVNDIIFKISPTNTLMVNNGKHTQKYLSNDDLYQDDGFIDTGDIIEVKNDRVYFQGKDSGAINVGGNKVQPEEVESVLLSSGLVNVAFVYPKNNPIMGNIVCADIILTNANSNTKTIKSEILKHCREKLENFKVPGIIKFVEEVEITQSGKLRRN